MKYSIETKIDIQAPVEKVWGILMDFPSYPDWNPFILDISGDKKIGGQLAIELEGMKFQPIVLKNIPNELFVWKGKFILKGIFDGEHSFRLEKKSDNSCRMYHSEKFSGILVRMMKGMLEGKTKQGFVAMNLALKNRAEQKI